MTISSSTRKAGPFDGNGVTTAFSFAFKVFATSDIRVVKTSALDVESDLVLDTHYTVTLNADQDNDPGGVVTYAGLATGTKLTIVGNLSELQPTDITNGGGFFPRVIENGLDRMVVYAQQLREVMNRTIRFPVSDSVQAVDLPVAGDRANKALIFDADGNVTVSDSDYNDQVAAVGALASAAAGSATAAASSEAGAAAQAVIAAGQAAVATGQAVTATEQAAIATAIAESIAGGPVASVNGMTGIVTGIAVTGANTFTDAQNEAKGANIASAATINLTTATGNFVHVTGVTAITAITIPVGAERTVVFDGVLTLTHGASLLLPGAANITTAANDRMMVRGDTAGATVVTYTKANGTAVVVQSVATQAELEAASSNSVTLTPLNANWHPGAAKAWLKCDATGIILASHNITSITDSGVGLVTVTLATDFSDSNYVVVTGMQGIRFPSVGSQGPGSFTLSSYNTSESLQDPLGYFVACYGDQA